MIRGGVPAMDTDREVAEQIAAVDRLIPDACAAASRVCGGLR